MTAWLLAILQRRMFAKPLVLGTKCVKSTIMIHLYLGAISGGHLRKRNQICRKAARLLISMITIYDLIMEIFN